ncbi:hypothetical protein JIN77_02200 [Verrucomicrobiaceae bacterium R5-34]|nr:hypothetical protein [Verrucomicrobiaceae bacterium R5-34]
MPCKNGTPKSTRPDPNAPIEMSCEISSMVEPNPVVHLIAQDLLPVLEDTRHIGDSMHPNKLEMEAQRALVRHSIRHHAPFRLNNDHWGRTGWAFLRLFEEGKGQIELGGVRYGFSELTKADWQEGDDPLAMQGGFTYASPEGAIVFKTMTWNS